MAKAKGNRRNIGIRFAIEGEKELNAQIGRLNAEFKRLETSLKLSKAEFAGQLNTEKALTAQMNVLKQQYQNTANAISVYENKQKNTCHNYSFIKLLYIIFFLCGIKPYFAFSF